MRPAPQTFSTKTSGEQWLTHTEADILGGDWIEERDLRPSAAQVYRYVLGRHLNPSVPSACSVILPGSPTRC